MNRYVVSLLAKKVSANFPSSKSAHDRDLTAAAAAAAAAVGRMVYSVAQVYTLTPNFSSSSLILASSSATAGVLGAAAEISEADLVPTSSVTHPSLTPFLTIEEEYFW